MFISVVILIAAMAAGALSCTLFADEIYAAVESARRRAQAAKRLHPDDENSAALASQHPKSLPDMVRQGVVRLLKHLPFLSRLLAATGLSPERLLTNEKEHEQLQDQIPPALDSLSVAVGSGLSLVQAFERVATEVKEPLASKFMLVPHGIQAGLSMKESLASLQTEFPEGEMETLFVTLDLHYRTGGNLAILLERTATMQRENNELRRELGVKTAQARFSAKVVGILPLGLLAALTLFSTDYIAAFFTSITGFVILVLALSMEAAGYVLVKRASEVSLA